MRPDLDTLAQLMPFARTLGIELEKATAEQAVAVLDHRPELCTAGGPVRAVATLVHRGRTTVTLQTDLYDGDERLVSRTTQVQAVKA